jgi:hypothetical protein
MSIKEIIGEHPANDYLDKLECGTRECIGKVVGVFEVRDGTEVIDVPLCQTCADKEKGGAL